MMQLSREVRFALADAKQDKITNSWSGWPSTNLLVPRLSVITIVEGEPEDHSGYICNIKLIDDLVRKILTQHIIPNFQSTQSSESVLQQIFTHSCEMWKISHVAIIEQQLIVSPYLKFTMTQNSSMIRVTQQFEFSASHRLHNPELSDQENRKLFGKCNNPNGHGHNYVVEVSLDRQADNRQTGIDLPDFEARVKELVIDRLDHKHLNKDVATFAETSPSVENIAVVIWEWLDGQFGDDKLSNIRVYETPKTWADFAG